MSKPLFLALHGMGEHTAESLTKEIVEPLDAAAAHFTCIGGKFSDKVEIVPIAYNDEWNDIRTRLSKNAGSVSDRLSGIEGIGGIVGIITELESEFGDDSRLYTHWLDVILYLTFYGRKVQVKVARAILDNLIKVKQHILPIHIMGHSLGTAVLHDTLHKLLQNDFTEEEQVAVGLDEHQVDPAGNQFNSIYMVANVSRLLKAGKHPYMSVVKPGQGGICHQMVNVHHAIDPFTWPFPFKPPMDGSWVSTEDLGRRIFRNTKIEEVTEFNVHGLSHYLANPTVYEDIFATVLQMDFMPKGSEINTAREAFKQKTIQDGYQKVEAAAKAAEFKDFDSLKDFYKAGEKFLKMVDELIKQAKN